MWKTGLELSEPIFHYKFVAILILFRFGYLFFSRKRFKFIKERIPRSPSDATWFLPVYIWGIEFLLYIKWLYDIVAGSGSLMSPALPFVHFLISLVILVIVIGLCFLQEFLARHIGMGVREARSQFHYLC
jgi:hypothetical protein